MRPCRGALFLLSLTAVLALATQVVVASEKCQPVTMHVGGQVSYDPGECPYPYDGDAAPTAELGCYVATVVGSVNGTWIYYWPAPNNCVFINSDGAEMAGSGWRPGKELWACWALSVFKTRHGDLFAEAGEMTHSDAFAMASLPYIDLEILTGGTGKYEGATGWIGGGADLDNGGVFIGQLCGTAKGKPAGKHGRGRK